MLAAYCHGNMLRVYIVGVQFDVLLRMFTSNDEYEHGRRTHSGIMENVAQIAEEGEYAQISKLKSRVSK